MNRDSKVEVSWPVRPNSDPKRGRLRMILLLLFVLLASYWTSAQVPQGGGFKITTEVDLVLLDVSVKDTKGGYVVDLTKDNFQVYENGALQKITEFVGSDIPVAVGLVMDNSGSMQRKRASLI